MTEGQWVVAGVGGYLLICLGIGIVAVRKTQTHRDFYLAGGQLGAVVTALAMFSSTLSGFGFVGGPALTLEQGFGSFWIIVATPVGSVLSVCLLARPLVRAAKAGCVSIPQWIGGVFESRALQGISAVAILLGSIAYLGTQFLAMGRSLAGLLEGAGLAGAELLGGGVSLFEVALVGSVLLVLLYTVAGGALAAAYTDVFQGLLMLLSAGVVLWVGSMLVPGGLTAAAVRVARDHVGAFGRAGSGNAVSWWWMFAVGAVAQPHVINKLMMVKNERSAYGALPLTVAAYGVAALLWVVVGLVMRDRLDRGEAPAGLGFDEATPYFLLHHLPVWGAMIAFAALFAAIMSTADAFLTVGAAAVSEDLPEALGWKREARVRLARWTTLVLGLVGGGVAWMAHARGGALIAWLGAFGWSTFAATIGPSVLFGALGVGRGLCRWAPWKGRDTQAGEDGSAPSWLIPGRKAGLSSAVVGLAASIGLRWVPDEWLAGWHTGSVAMILSFVTYGVVARACDGRARRPLMGSITQVADGEQTADL